MVTLCIANLIITKIHSSAIPMRTSVTKFSACFCIVSSSLGPSTPVWINQESYQTSVVVVNCPPQGSILCTYRFLKSALDAYIGRSNILLWSREANNQRFLTFYFFSA